MRTYLFLLFTAFFVHLNLASQEKFGEYALLLEEGRVSSGPYDLKISREKQLLYVFMRPLSESSKKEGEGGIELSIKKKQHQAFISALINAKQKFVEWDSVAKKNNVNEEVRKEMNFRLNGIKAFFKYGSRWHFQKWLELSFYFMYQDKKPILYVGTPRLTASDNQYMRHDGFSLYFDDISKIDEFVDMISDSKIQEFLSSPPATDLFKD